MRSVLVAVLFSISAAAGAQSDGKAPWNSYGDRIKSSQEVSPLGPDLFGDQISLSNGGLSFTATDVSVPGNSSIPVALTRRYQVKDWRHRIADGMLKDWDLDLPNVSGTFATEWVGQHFSTGVISAARCSNPNRPPLPTSYEGLAWQDFWRGVSINIPGVTGGELLQTSAATTRPSTGGPYGWMTNDQVHVMCLPSIKNGSGAYGNGGEGFLAVAPDGTKYWFDWMARSHEPPLKRGSFVTNYSRPGPIYWTQVLPIYRYALYATRIEDRFGNAVELTYSNAWNQPPRLTSIKDAAGGEGRQINITYTGGAISSVTDGTRTWNYSYGTTGSGRGTLTSVAQSTPDNPNSNVWAINFAQFTNAEIIYPEANTEGARNCFMLQDPSNYALTPVGTITHPSGAVGTFTMKLKEHNRSNVPVNCDNIIIYEGAEGNDENDDTPRYPFSFISLTLDSKSISGPNLTTAQWTYSYDSDRIDQMAHGATFQNPRCTLSLQSDCMKPVCLSEDCAGRSRTTVRGPNNEWTHYSHGNSYRYNEGKLLAVDVGQGSGPTYAAPPVGGLPKKVVNNSIQRTTTSYDLSRTAQASPTNWGSSQQLEGDGFQDEYRRPWTGTVIRLQGVDFSRQATVLDAFDRPTTEVKASIGGSNTTRTDTTEYHDNLAKWVIGQVARTRINGTQTSRTEFNTFALPIRHRVMGDFLVQEVSYHANGVPHTIKDGKGNITAATDWYRGLPRLVTYADSTTQSAVVSPLGWITQVTDQNGFATTYGYDSVGRLKLIQYPVGDTVAWNSTNLSFTKLTSAELGFPIGTWRQQVYTGTGYKRTYFDAMWRPRLTHEYDSANTAGTSRYNAWTYDHDGRTTFSAYPVAAATSTASLTQGVWSSYDRLGRPTTVSSDSELGILTSFTEYLTGFQIRTTNARGKATTTTYQTFDTPDTSRPLVIDAPLGQRTAILRDIFGRTTRVTRQGTLPGQTETQNRRYVYDPQGRLCKLLEPETGATVMSYDTASNLVWSAAGLPLTVSAETDCTNARTAAYASGRRVDRTYDSRNRMLTLSYPDGNGNQIWTYTPDGLPDDVTTHNNNNDHTVLNGYQYDRRRNLVSETQAQPGWYTWAIGYGYNANGHLASQSYPSGIVVGFAPNALGQPTQAGTYATGVQYFPNGAMKQFTYGNGILHTLSQNSRQLPHTSSDSHGVHSQYYGYDENGNVVATLDNLDSARSRWMAYDDLDRLLDAGSVVFGGDHWHHFTYDVLDNLRSWKLAGVKDYASYNYDPATNRLTNITNTGGAVVQSFAYDPQGNVTTRNGSPLEFNFGNQLRSAQNQEGYRYDARGRRVLAWRASGGSTLSMYTTSGQVAFVYSDPLQRETDNVYLNGSLVAIRERTFGNVVNVKYQHTDALGSPVAVTNQAGTVIERTNYEPYGKAIGKSIDGVGYTGHMMDPVTNLVYMQQRYYDPVGGRFLSVDPVSADAGTGANFNRYWYANNNPYRFTDPDGRQAVPEQMILPSGIRSTSHIPRNEAEARSYGTAPAVPFNKANFARDMDELSDKANVVEVGALATGHVEAAAIAGVISTVAGVAALAVEPTVERAVDVATGGVFGALSKGSKLLDNPAAREALQTGADGLDTGKKVLNAAETLSEKPKSREVENN